jgi:hypothetical protein
MTNITLCISKVFFLWESEPSSQTCDFGLPKVTTLQLCFASFADRGFVFFFIFTIFTPPDLDDLWWKLMG